MHCVQWLAYKQQTETDCRIDDTRRARLKCEGHAQSLLLRGARQLEKK